MNWYNTALFQTSSIPRASKVDRRPCAPNAPSATARKQSTAAIRKSTTDMLLLEASSPHLQPFFQVGQRRLSASASRSDIENCSSHSEGRCSEKIQCWSEFPQIRTQNCTATDYQITNKIVGTHHLAAFSRIAVSDDECLTGCIAKFLQAADRKRDDQSRKTARYQQSNWKKREHDEGHNHEWLAAMPIRVMRGG